MRFVFVLGLHPCCPRTHSPCEMIEGLPVRRTNADRTGLACHPTWIIGSLNQVLQAAIATILRFRGRECHNNSLKYCARGYLVRFVAAPTGTIYAERP